MKRFVKLLSLLVVSSLSLCIAGCSDQDDVNPAPEFIGVWRIAGISYDNTNYESWTNEPTTLSFATDLTSNNTGTFHFSGYYGESSGIWKTNGKKVICYIKTLKEIIKQEEDGITITYKEVYVPITECELISHKDDTCIIWNSDIGDNECAWFYCVKINQ